jgi:hypothetical protein
MADRHLNKCKACCKAYARLARQNPILANRIQEHDFARKLLPKRMEQRIRQQNKQRKLYPEKYAARTALNNAIRDGHLKKEVCEICGSNENVHGHHENYANQLDVIWLCVRCHHKLHRLRQSDGQILLDF